MKTSFKFILVQALSLLLAFQPAAHAVFVANSKSEVAPDLDPQSDAVRTQILLDYSEVRTAAQFVNRFGGRQSEIEKTKAQAQLAKLSELPKLEAIEHGIEFSLENVVYKIDLRAGKAGRFVINGVDFKFDPSAPWSLQADVLSRKLAASSHGKYSLLYSLSVPTAEAVVITIVKTALSLVAIGALNNAVGLFGNDLMMAGGFKVCEILKKSNSSLLENPFVCKDSKLQWEKKAKETPEVAAAKNALGTEKKSDLFSTSDEKCPHETGGKFYQSTISKYNKQPEKPSVGTAQSKDKPKALDAAGLESVGILTGEMEGKSLKNATYSELVAIDHKGKPIPKGKNGQMRVATDKDGKPLYLIGKDGKPVTTLVVSFKLDGDGQLSEINVPAAQVPSSLKDQLSGSSELKIKTTADIENQPLLKNLKDADLAIFQHLGDRLSVCKIKNDEAQVAKATTASPASGKPTGEAAPAAAK
jgi:hypothetical protein